MIVYPNPSKVSDRVEFDLNIKGEFALEVYDYSGKIVFHKSGEMNSDLFVDAGALKHGLYFVNVKSEGKIYRSTLLVLNN